MSRTVVPRATEPAVTSLPSAPFTLVVVVESDLGSYSLSKCDGQGNVSGVDEIRSIALLFSLTVKVAVAVAPPSSSPFGTVTASPVMVAVPSGLCVIVP